MTILNIAHRGGASLRPENTMPAFENAIALGCDGAELDVRFSADNVVVVHHDDQLNPAYTSDAAGEWLAAPTPLVENLTLAQLRIYDLGRVRPDSDYAAQHPALAAVKNARIPTLAEVAAAARAAPRLFTLMVELKSSAQTPIEDAMRLADAALEVMKDDLARTIFVGFDWRGLLRIRRQSPEARVWFTTDKLAGDVTPVLDMIAAEGGEGWFPHFENVTQQTAAAARARALKIGAWTVNDAQDLKRVAGLGPDIICTDRPVLLQAVLQALEQSR